jgi:quercetin dioxygenase-like cupin family protein
MSQLITNEKLWFLNTLIIIRIPYATGTDGMSIVEHRLPYGDSVPLHIHHTEDEIFHILEGQFRFQLAGRRFSAGPGEIILAPKGVPHTYLAESRQGGRYLTTTCKGDFERLVRALARPAERDELPPPVIPTPQMVEKLKEVCMAHRIELVGPPLELAENARKKQVIESH